MDNDDKPLIPNNWKGWSLFIGVSLAVWIVLSLIGIGLSKLTASANTNAAPAVSVFHVLSKDESNTIEEWRDPTSGCRYIVWDAYEKGGITPMRRPDGTVDCPANPPAQKPDV